MTKAFTPDKKHRNRRIASDEAHAWARNLRLRNSLAKLVLTMLCGYVNGDGVCIVGVPALAADTELAQETVRRRLAWLEDVGVITRIPQWWDGRQRNGDGRGQRTSDDVRLMIDADVDLIEARAAGDIDAEQRIAARREQVAAVSKLESGPLPQTGLNDEGPSEGGQRENSDASEKNLTWDSTGTLAAPSLRTGPESFEPEPEGFPPTPPSGGAGPDDQNREEAWPHAESWAELETTWGEPILHQSLCRQLWQAFTDVERKRFIEVVRGYNAWRSSQRRPPNRCNLQKLMRERDAWSGYEARAPEKTKPQPVVRFIDGDCAEFKALQIADIIANVEMRQPKPCDGYGEGCLTRRETPRPDFLALGCDRSFDLSSWCELEVERDGHAIGAWRRRFAEWGLGELAAERVSTDEIFAISPSGIKLYRKREILIVPRYWPPLVNGNWPEKQQGPPLNQPLATDEDLKEFAKTG